MASILHVCDADMIEFHRINGNKTINFWRPSPSNRFSNFHLGDYLFFYVYDFIFDVHFFASFC